MTEDGKVVIDTEINTDGAKKGINNLNNELKKSTSAQKLNIASLAKLGTAVGAVTAATKVAAKVIKECTETYKGDLQAQKQLEQAAKNNPYLNNASVQSLNNYAAALTKISTVSGGELTANMAKLASTGRTQAEIQNIMSAALDLSASGMMSLDSAIDTLNGTLNGSAGALGKQINEIKDLTEAELKSGKAIDIIKEKYGGMSEEITKATGATSLLKNAQDDFNSAVGKFVKPTSDLWNKFWTGFFERGTQVITDLEDAIDKRISAKAGKKGVENLIKSVGQLSSKDAYKLEFSRIINNKDDFSTAEVQAMKDALEVKSTLTEKESILLGALQKRLNNEIAITNEIDKQNKKEKETVTQESLDNDKAEKAKNNYKETVEQAAKEIELRRELGQSISGEEAEQEMLNVRMAAYLKMIEEAEGTISGNVGFAKTEKERIAADAKRLNGEDTNSKAKDVVEQWEKEQSQTLQTQLEMLNDYADYLRQKERLSDEEIQMQAKIASAQLNIQEEMRKQQKEKLASNLSDINDYVSEFASITNSMTDLIRSSNEEQTNQEMTDLSKQYTDGLITYEEYCEKKKAIDKKAAQEEYKLKMWEWSASLLQATANIAEGVSKAIAQGGIAGIITGALVAASGAIQIASITANKPQAPQFATGGIVGGSSYTGDKVPAMLNSREMVLNMGQQQRLFDIANGTANGGTAVNMPVTINNNSSANVSTKINKNGLIVMIDEIVSSSMESGKYTQSMNVAQSRANGAAYY